MNAAALTIAIIAITIALVVAIRWERSSRRSDEGGPTSHDDTGSS